MSKREKKKASKVEHTKSRRQLAERQRPGWRARVLVEREWEVQKTAVGGSRDQASYPRMPGASTRARPLMAVSAVVRSAEMKVWRLGVPSTTVLPHISMVPFSEKTKHSMNLTIDFPFTAPQDTKQGHHYGLYSLQEELKTV